MQTILFLSDAHFGAGPPALDRAKERDLVSFLDHLAPGARLYLLGDVFDFWFDFGGPPPGSYQPIVDALRRAVGRGVPVSFMGGNHDHWARTGRDPGWLEREVGLEVIADPHVVEHQGVRLLLCHGDALGGARGVYRVVRTVLHSPLAIRAFRLLPASVGYRLGALTSRLSRDRHDEVATATYADRLRAEAERILAREPVDAVVAGHVHIPERRETVDGVYLNLGDWILHRTYGRLVRGELTLETFAPT